MIDFDTLSQFVRGDLLENHSKEEIELMSIDEAFDAWLSFNGIINYSLTIRQVLFDIATSSHDVLIQSDQREGERSQRLYFGLEDRDILR